VSASRPHLSSTTSGRPATGHRETGLGHPALDPNQPLSNGSGAHSRRWKLMDGQVSAKEVRFPRARTLTGSPCRARSPLSPEPGSGFPGESGNGSNLAELRSYTTRSRRWHGPWDGRSTPMVDVTPDLCARPCLPAGPLPVLGLFFRVAGAAIRTVATLFRKGIPRN